MKRVFIYCTIAFLSIGYANSQNQNHASLKWQDNYSKAQKIAKNQQKELLVFFTGSDWCGPCKMLVEDFFESNEFKEVADENLVLYEADFPRDRELITNAQREMNEKLGSKYGVNSYPTVIVFDSKGKEIARRKSYNLMRDPSYYFEFISNIIE